MGYNYSVGVVEPEGNPVTVALEVWDPSAGEWLPQPTQSLAQGQGQGRLSWEVVEPFDTWDSGLESRFRFVYDDGSTQGTTAGIPGPFNMV